MNLLPFSFVLNLFPFSFVSAPSLIFQNSVVVSVFINVLISFFVFIFKGFNDNGHVYLSSKHPGY